MKNYPIYKSFKMGYPQNHLIKYIVWTLAVNTKDKSPKTCTRVLN